VYAVSDAAGHTLWQWPVPEGTGAAEIWAVRPGKAGRPGTVVVRAGSTVVGLDSATGRPRWRGQGPGEPQALLDTPDATDPPRILWRSDSVTICRLALPVGDDGRYQVAAPSPEDYPPPIEDPWQFRPLPWALLATPRWGLLVLPAALLYLLVVRGARRTYLFLIGAVVVGTVVAGGIWLALDRRYLDDAQHYAWAGWYRLGERVLLVVGLLTLLALFALGVGRFVRRLWRMARRRIARRPAGPNLVGQAFQPDPSGWKA
jgi:hypothetical protein